MKDTEYLAKVLDMVEFAMRPTRVVKEIKIPAIEKDVRNE